MHGSETYYVVGEGLLSEANEDGGAPPTASLASVTASAAAAPPFRFSRVAPKGTQLGDPARKKLAIAMTAGGGGFGDVPAGFTYFGQFVDHDLTFDKTTVSFGANVSAADLLQGRSPALDLDSLYGKGPGNPGSAKFFKDDRHLKMGKTEAVGAIGAKQGFDLPRDDKAVIPDKRNDENLAVAQTHLAMARFHNRVVDTALPAGTAANQRFVRARELVVKHYQWVIRHDYLPRILEPSVVDDVFTNGRKIFEKNAVATDVPTMPIEFSVAAFRLGHSMVRREYAWNHEFPDDQGTLDFLFAFSGTSGFVGGGSRLPSNWIADWRRLYDLTETGRNDLKAPPGQFNKARRIDTLLADPLKFLPSGSFGGKFSDEGTIRANLAFRNLTRAKMVKLATGQKAVDFCKSKGVNVTLLTKAKLRDGDGGASLSGLTAAQREKVLANSPLWFYVLREAELNGGRLKGVGARIVAETIHRAMEGSRFSIVRDPAFRPSLGPNNTTFRMSDLLLFAFEGKKDLLAPLG
ncbi:MAG TPA: heme peroxidase family protein [Solirubrobacteraceae bacterium]|nr:heme peroxidase family protein [Solirubrobacteraceae bacterium]